MKNTLLFAMAVVLQASFIGKDYARALCPF
jgi:hypothetical protein